MAEKGIIYVISAPAGCGKDTILNKLFEVTDSVGYAVSATTRPARKGEIGGVHYNFLTREDFEEKIDNNEFVEYTEYCGNYYGTLRSAVQEVFSQGKDVILKIEVEGAMNIRKQFPDACLIFILPPSWDALEARLRGRNTESETKLHDRLNQALTEILYAKNYDYLIVNDKLDTAVEDLYSVLHAEKLKRSRCEQLLEEFNRK